MERQKENVDGDFLAVQWLGLRASTAGGTGSIPGRGTKIPHAEHMVQPKKIKFNLKKKKKKNVDGRKEKIDQGKVWRKGLCMSPSQEHFCPSPNDI